MKTIFEQNLERLYLQTTMNNNISVLEKTTPQSITRHMNLGEFPVYPKKSQLDFNLSYNETDITPQYEYPPLKITKQQPDFFTTFNYGIHKYITTKPIDVSGYLIPNNELRVIPNRGTETLYRPQIMKKNID